MTYGISTSWNAGRQADAGELIEEIKAAGFDAIELSFALSPSVVDAIARAAKAGGVGILSLHNYCPFPETEPPRRPSPDMFLLSSLDEEERRCAVKWSRHTIDTASRLAARAVVLHAGRVEIEDRTRRLAGVIEKGEDPSELRSAMVNERASEVEKGYLNSLMISLEALTSYAAESGVRLCIETRFYYREIPTIDEFDIIFGRFRKGELFYWHDTGHAQVMENLGFAGHREYLERFGDRLAGLHLHGVKGLIRDHRPPSVGGVDFTMLKPYVRNDTLKIIEAHDPATVDKIREGADHIRKILC